MAKPEVIVYISIHYENIVNLGTMCMRCYKYVQMLYVEMPSDQTFPFQQTAIC